MTTHGPQGPEYACFWPFLQAENPSDYPVITEYRPEAG